MMVTALSRVAKTGRVRPVLAALIIGLVAAGTAAADDPSKEFWPEIDAWWRVSPAWRLSLFVPLSENLDTHYREGILLSSRLRADLRRRGQHADFSTRWRFRAMVEKEITAGRASIVPYVNVEPYYDSRYDTVSRVRLIPGATVAWSPRAAIEGNVTYQYDSHASATHVVALNVILHVCFDTSRSP